MGCIIWGMFLWTRSLGALQTIEVFYGTYMATEVAYYTYIYAKVEREHFQMVTGFTKSAILAGRFLSATVSQLMVSFGLLDLHELNYLSFGCEYTERFFLHSLCTQPFRPTSFRSVLAQIISLLWAIVLPSVGNSLYFNANPTASSKHSAVVPDSDVESTPKIRKYNGEVAVTKTPGRVNRREQWKNALRLLYGHFIESYSDPVVVQWSLWWALAMCGFTQVQMYSQFLWQTINPDHANVFNGAVEAMLTLLSVAGAFAAGFIKSKRFEAYNVWVLTVCSALQGGVLLWGTLTDSVWIAYIGYVIFGVLTHFMVTLAR